MDIHSQSIITACNNIGLNAELVSGTLIKVKINQQPFYFLSGRTPLNSQMHKRIVDDKKYTYDLLLGKINMPKTFSFIDPKAYRIYKSFVTHSDQIQIAKDIQQKLGTEIIIKPNNGSKGRNIFHCKSKADITLGIKKVFTKNRRYTHVLLAQQLVNIKHEYRVTVLNKKIILVYEKDFSNAKFNKNISPLHAKGSKAVIITNKKLLARIQKFINPIFDEIPLEYTGLDIAIDNNNKMWLIEVNANPRYNYLVRDNGLEVLVFVFEKILKYIKKKIV